MTNVVLSNTLALVCLIFAYAFSAAITYIIEGIMMENLRELIVGILIVLICVGMVFACYYFIGENRS